MPNVKISGLPPAYTLSSTDVIPVVAGTATSKITLADFSSTLLTVNSASYALTASYALNGGSGGGSIATSGSTLYSTDPAIGGGFNTVNSIFLGDLAGYQAHSASGSNFLGYNAGYGAYYAYNSNMLGFEAGYTAYSASNSNFFGQQAGDQAFNARNSNFFGYYAGKGAVDAVDSNFLGQYAGYLATSAFRSNFLGYAAGNSATNADHSNFFGHSAGDNATNAYGSNFIGWTAGLNATDANNSNFLGYGAGQSANNASYSSFIGYKAGNGALGSVGSNNVIIGTNITLETGRADSINLGGIIFATGSYNDVNTNPFSGSLGNGMVGINVVNPQYTLEVAGTVSASAFIGDGSGLTNIPGAAIATNGSTLYSVNPLAGSGFSADNSVFFGSGSGDGASGADGSNFIGQQAGYQATFAEGSNFFGGSSGKQATYAAFSNFIGKNAGLYATDASYSIAIGYRSGYNPLGSIGANNIVIGTNITLEAGRADSINLGGVIFASGAYNDISTVPFSGSLGNGMVGINVVNPTTALHVSGTVSASAFIGDGSGLTNVGGGGSGPQNIVTSSIPSDKAEYSSSLYFALQPNVPAQGGTVYLENGLVDIIGTDTQFIGDSGITTLDYWFEFWVYDSTLSKWWWVEVDYINDDTTAYIWSVQDLDDIIANGWYTDQYTDWPGTTGNYQFYIGRSMPVGYRSFSNGYNSIASGSYSYAQGGRSIAKADNQFVVGVGNMPSTAPGAFIIGNGDIWGNIPSNLVFASGSQFQVTGSVIATYFVGDGSGLTNIPNGSISTNGTTLYSNNPATSQFSTNKSIIFGEQAGYQAYFAAQSNFLGYYAGTQATNAGNSNFFGYQAGYQATYANGSNFFGLTAGSQATNADHSNFLGMSAGFLASNANYSNFLGYQAGYQATYANYSNFFGQQAGYRATNASFSNFLGVGAGVSASNAAYSNLFGLFVGKRYAGSSGIGSNNIIIGTNITLPDNYANGVNIGGLIFGSASYSTTSGNPFSGSANGKVGINQPVPVYSFDVSGSGNFTNGLTVTGSLLITGSVTINNILTLVSQSVLPTIGVPSGSFMTSGSGTDLKPYFWNGSTWTALF